MKPRIAWWSSGAKAVARSSAHIHRRRAVARPASLWPHNRARASAVRAGVCARARVLACASALSCVLAAADFGGADADAHRPSCEPAAGSHLPSVSRGCPHTGAARPERTHTRAHSHAPTIRWGIRVCWRCGAVQPAAVAALSKAIAGAGSICEVDLAHNVLGRAPMPAVSSLIEVRPHACT